MRMPVVIVALQSLLISVLSATGTATGSCIGNGTFTAGNPTAVLSIDPRGAGTLSGQGTWTTPRGSFSGNGVR